MRVNLRFVPSLQYCADWLQLSPAVAGITLLALGNGANDVFTAIAALDSDDFPLVCTPSKHSFMYPIQRQYNLMH
jgi:hypothetical protein